MPVTYYFNAVNTFEPKTSDQSNMSQYVSIGNVLHTFEYFKSLNMSFCFSNMETAFVGEKAKKHEWWRA